MFHLGPQAVEKLLPLDDLLLTGLLTRSAVEELTGEMVERHLLIQSKTQLVGARVQGDLHDRNDLALTDSPPPDAVKQPHGKGTVTPGRNPGSSIGERLSCDQGSKTGVLLPPGQHPAVGVLEPGKRR